MRSAPPSRAGMRTAGLVLWGLVPLLGGLSLQFANWHLWMLAIAVAWTACLVGFPVLPEILRGGRVVTIGVLVSLIPYWFSGFDSPYHWDAVQTAIRARCFWETGRLERFSLFYVVLSPFVSIGASSPVAAHLFAMCLGVLTLVALGCGAAAVCGREWALPAAIAGAVLSGFFVTYRWVTPDALLVLLWTLSLVAAVRWARDLDFKRGLGLTCLCAATAATKEMGGLILFPVALALILLVPRERRTSGLVWAGAVVAVCAGLAAFSLTRYARSHGIEDYLGATISSDRGLTFLLKPRNVPDGLATAFKPLVRHHLLFWAQSGLLVPIAFALLPARTRRAGLAMILGGLAAQTVWLVMSAQWGRTDACTFPVFNGHVPGIALAPFALFALVLCGIGAARGLRPRIDRISWVLLAGIVPVTLALLCFAKVGRDDQGRVVALLAWNYPVVALAGGLLLAVRGLKEIARISLPRWVRLCGLFVLALTVTCSCLDGLNVATRIRIVDCAREEVYRRIAAGPVRTVYTHWPFVYESPDGIGMDNGRLRWKSDGWRVRNIREIAEGSAQPERPAILLWDVSRDYSLPLAKLESLGRETDAIEIAEWDSPLLRPSFSQFRGRAVIIRIVE